MEVPFWPSGEKYDPGDRHELYRGADRVPRHRAEDGRKARRTDCGRDRRDRSVPARTREAVRRDGADAALGAGTLRRSERQPDPGLPRPRGDFQGLAGLRLDRGPQHHVHHAAASLRLRGAADQIPADHRQGRRRHGDRDIRASSRLRCHRDQHARAEGRRQLRPQRPQAMVQLWPTTSW